MDYETVAECFYEAWTNGPHKEDAVHYLSEEFRVSEKLSDMQRKVLLDALAEVQRANAYGHSEPLERVWGILVQHDQFLVEWGRVIREWLLGRR